MAKISPRQSRFVDEYMIDLNATQAYIRAGYSTQGARASAAKLQTVPAVRQEIDRRLAESSARTGVTKDRIIREYARIAFADATDIINEDGSLKAASRDNTAAIAGIKVKRSTFGEDGESIEREIKLVDKKAALDALAKLHGWLNDRQDVHLTGGATIKIDLVGADEDDEDQSDAPAEDAADDGE